MFNGQMVRLELLTVVCCAPLVTSSFPHAGMPLRRDFCSKRFPLLVPALRLLTKFGHLLRQDEAGCFIWALGAGCSSVLPSHNSHSLCCHSVEYLQSITYLLRTLLSRRALPLEENLALLLAAVTLSKAQACIFQSHLLTLQAVWHKCCVCHAGSDGSGGRH